MNVVGLIGFISGSIANHLGVLEGLTLNSYWFAGFAFSPKLPISSEIKVLKTFNLISSLLLVG